MTFDSSLAGTSAAAWAADPRLHDRPALTLAGVDEVLVLAAHPDDETLGAGSLIAACVRAGIPVRIVVVTDGAASGVPGIADRRARELGAAASALGASAITLGFADGRTDDQRDGIRAALEPIVGPLSDRAMVVAPWRGDGHVDHRVVGELAAELAGERRLVEYPIWMWHWADPAHPEVPWTRMVSVPADAAQAVALEQYVSQSEGPDPVLRPDFLEHFARPMQVLIADPGLDGRYFDATYEIAEDPWGFRTRWYERRKRDLTVASLPLERYGDALELGCSIGVLTEQLVQRVDRVLAVDVSQAAVDSARRALGDRATVQRMDVAASFPPGRFDLVVFSEVGYYFGEVGLARVLDGIEAALGETGTLVACHWRHPVADYPMSGDAVHERIRARGIPRIAVHAEADFVLEVFSRDPRSVAAQAGLA